MFKASGRRESSLSSISRLRRVRNTLEKQLHPGQFGSDASPLYLAPDALGAALFLSFVDSRVNLQLISFVRFRDGTW